MTEYKITEEKLNSKDHFRVQTQLKDREDKLAWGTKYEFLKMKTPKKSQMIRDFTGPKTIVKLNEVFDTVMESNPSFKSEYREWLKKNVETSDLLNEALKL